MTGQGTTSAERRSSVFAALRETVLIVVLSLVIATLVRIFVVQAFLIPSQSMEDTLLIDDRVLVSKLTKYTGGVDRGDIIVFADPGGWLAPEDQVRPGGLRNALRNALEFVGVLPSDTEGHLIKRVIGVGGDHVTCCDAHGRIAVNGRAIDESSYLFPGDAPSVERFDVRVPAGDLWVMGDHRSNSGDSRVHGFVPEDKVVGRSVLVIWPLSRISALSRPDVFDRVPAAQTASSGSAPP